MHEVFTDSFCEVHNILPKLPPILNLLKVVDHFYNDSFLVKCEVISLHSCCTQMFMQHSHFTSLQGNQHKPRTSPLPFCRNYGIHVLSFCCICANFRHQNTFGCTDSADITIAAVQENFLYASCLLLDYYLYYM